jgi:hypothetical protein
MQAASPKRPLRVCAYLLPPKRRIVKDRGRVVTVLFAVKMEAYSGGVRRADPARV